MVAVAPVALFLILFLALFNCGGLYLDLGGLYLDLLCWHLVGHRFHTQGVKAWALAKLDTGAIAADVADGFWLDEVQILQTN